MQTYEHLSKLTARSLVVGQQKLLNIICAEQYEYKEDMDGPLSKKFSLAEILFQKSSKMH